MGAALDKSVVSKLGNSFAATPGVTKDQAEAFRTLLNDLARPGVTERDAEQRLRGWAGKAPKHAVLVVRSALLGSTYMRAVPRDSWVVKAIDVPAK